MLISFFILACYYPTVFAPFNSIDDLKLINHLLNIDSVDFVRLFFPHGTGQYYRPLLYVTFIVDNYVWGLQESFMHLENILLQLCSALLVYGITRKILQMQGVTASLLPFAAAFLFGLHPLATEPVNWVSGRTDLLAGLFVFASFLLFLQSLESHSYWRAALGGLLLLVGCLAKETALFILPGLIFWSFIPPRDLTIRSFSAQKLFLPSVYALAGATYLGMRWLALSGDKKIATTIASGSSSNDSAITLWNIVWTALKGSGFYFKKLIIPVPLNFGIVEISHYYFWLGLLVCLGIIYCLYRRDLASYLFLASFCLVSPALVLPLLKITWTPVAERYAYIASAPFVIAVCLIFVRYLKPHLSMRAVTLATALLMGSAGIVTAQRNIVWQDNFTLYDDTVKKSPRFAAARNELAIALHKQGRSDEAYAILLANCGDDFQPASLNKVRVYVNQGKLSEARRILQMRPGIATAADAESLTLMIKIDELRLKEAVSTGDRYAINLQLLESLKQLFTINGDPFDKYRLGLVQLRLGDKSDARQSFVAAWQGAPPTSHYREAARKLALKLQIEQDSNSHNLRKPTTRLAPVAK